MLSHLSLGALAVAGAAAFMIPPNVALESASTPAVPMLTDPFSIKIFAPCEGCPYAEFNDKGYVWTDGVDNSLYLDVAVGNNLDTLQLNGVQIYPPPSPLRLPAEPVVPRIAQVKSTVPLRDVEKSPEKYLAHPLKMTEWGVSATTVHSLKETGEEVIKLQLLIGALEGKSINLPTIVITALKNPEVHLMVLNVELEKPQTISDNCHGLPLLCKWKAAIADMAKTVKGKMRGKCHKARPHHISAAEQHKEEEEQPSMPPRPHHKGHHHHGHHHHHRHMHRFLHKVARVLLSIVVPLLLGVLAGVLTYTFGMLLGTFIAMIWIRVRGMRSDYQPIALDDEEVPRESFEKGEFLEEVFVEAPPVYVEVEGKEVGRQE